MPITEVMFALAAVFVWMVYVWVVFTSDAVFWNCGAYYAAVIEIIKRNTTKIANAFFLLSNACFSIESSLLIYFRIIGCCCSLFMPCQVNPSIYFINFIIYIYILSI